MKYFVPVEVDIPGSYELYPSNGLEFPIEWYITPIILNPLLLNNVNLIVKIVE